MHRSLSSFAWFIATFAFAACSGPDPWSAATLTDQGSVGVRYKEPTPEWISKHLARRACKPLAGEATCLALILSERAGGSIQGWKPRDYQKRYHLPSSTNGSGQIVAIVDALDSPSVASDLAVYRKQFRLGKANFTKFNQDGQISNYPPPSSTWGVEIDLDVEMVSAACPKCTIYLIEANGFDTTNMDAAEEEAVKLGAHIVSNSWICEGSNSCVSPDAFKSPVVVYLAASGDDGYDKNGAPESFATVVSVGGTVMTKSGATYHESVWDGSGGGCSDNGGTIVGIPKPSWQHDPSCAYRTDVDVSAVAWDTAMYDSFDEPGWLLGGGTSAATPLNAAIFALAGNAGAQTAASGFWTAKQKTRKRDFHYISTGNDGSCGGSYLCTAGTNQFTTYAGPIGWGTPNGTGLY